MPSPNTISVEKLTRLVGTPKCPALVDVRDARAFDADPSLVPSAMRCDPSLVSNWAGTLAGQTAVVVSEDGLAAAEGTAAWLRHEGVAAEVLDGGWRAWRASGQPAVPWAKLPPRDSTGRTRWVTRARPKIDRIACPWLVRRFVDPGAVFLFVAPSEVVPVANEVGGAPFDIEEVFWSHRGESCTFDTMIEELGLATPPLLHLASIVRGADTARLGIAPEAAGLLAVSLGLSRMYADDLKQLDAGMVLYDALYRWCRDATDETHNWPTNRPSA